jgi:hypothetical protein
MDHIANNSPTPDADKRPRGRPPGSTAIVMALRRDAALADTPEAVQPMQPDRRGGRRQGAGRPPRDPAARAAWEAQQDARRAAEGKPPKPEHRGGYRPNSGRRRGDGARANETGLTMAARWMREQQTMTSRWRREMRAWIARNKLPATTNIEGDTV